MGDGILHGLDVFPVTSGVGEELDLFLLAPQLDPADLVAVVTVIQNAVAQDVDLRVRCAAQRSQPRRQFSV